MSEFMYDKEKYIEEHEEIIFENNTDSSFDVETGIIFHKSGLYDVDISNNHVIVSKVDERKAIEEAYQNGFETGQHEATTLEYQQCLDDAWEAAKKIFALDDFEAEKCGLDDVDGMTVSEAIAKLRKYEQQKADEIKVGDIITDGKINYLVTDITDKSYVALQGTDFEPVYIGKDYIGLYNNLHDSKDMQKIAEEINKAIKSEQRDCHTCKHQVASSIECVDCRSFGRWQPKEGVE